MLLILQDELLPSVHKLLHTEQLNIVWTRRAKVAAVNGIGG